MSAEQKFGQPTISDWFAARGIDDPAIVAPVVAAFAAAEAVDYYPSHEALSDLVHLMSEEDAIGGGPGFSERWDKAKRRAFGLFEP